jgi:hypothetical protein|nr:MAG TPA: Protein CXorf40A-overexpressed LPS associated factor 1 [Caudoviricetes sp.]
MSKAVLISIRPKWCEKIASGEKTIEVRKTRPKMETPFKCYIYCTQSADMLWILKERERSLHPDKIADVFKAAKCGGAYRGNGKVIGEFVCDRIDTILPENEPYGIYNIDDDYVFQTCLEYGALWNYGNGQTLYGWHISNLNIYDEPKELGEFTAACRYKNDDGTCPSRRIACSFQRYDYNPDGSINIVECGNTIRRPPQSWGYVEELP